MAWMAICGTRRSKEKSAFVLVVLSLGDVSVGVVGAGTVDHGGIYP